MASAATAALRERIQSDAPIVWNFLGDSITHGALHTWGRRDYVELFAERVRWQLRRMRDIVINAGCSGFTVPAVADGLAHWCLRFRPDVVCLMQGVNDALAGPDGVAAFERAYLALVTEIRRGTDAHVVLQTPNPLDYPNAQTRAALPEYAAAVRRVAAEADVPLCDHEAVWEAYAVRHGHCQYLLNDALHPNADGHLLFANTLLDWLGYGRMAALTPLDGFAPESPAM